MTDSPMKIAVLAFADTFGVVTSLLVRDEATFEQSVIRAADQWHYPPPVEMMLPPGSHHSAVVKHDFEYVLPPQFDSRGEVTNAPIIDSKQISQFAAKIQQKLFAARAARLPATSTSDTVIPLPPSTSPFPLRVAARQKPRHYERDNEEKSSPPQRALHGPKKKK